MVFAELIRVVGDNRWPLKGHMITIYSITLRYGHCVMGSILIKYWDAHF
jgi:hypothetical protein